MPNNPSREAFEAKFSQSPYEFEMDRCGPDSSWPGGYREYHVQCAWEGWQAGAQAERERLAKIAESRTDGWQSLTPEEIRDRSAP